MQIERKFLLDYNDFSTILPKSAVKTKIKEFFVSFLPEIRYQMAGKSYFLLHKNGGKIQKFSISKAEFDDARKNKIAKIIQKSVVYAELNGVKFEFEIYEKELCNLVILNVFFQYGEFDEQKFFENVKFSDISNDKRFNSANLALFGKPQSKFDVKKAYEILTKNPNLKFKIPSYLDSFDAILTILRLIFNDIKIYKDEFLNDKNSESLHKFRISLRKFRAILKQSTELFEPNSANEILKILKIIANKTNEKRDLEIFFEKLSFLNTPNLLLETLENRKKIVSDNLENLFKSQNFEIFLASLETFLSDENRSFSHTSYEKISKKFTANLLLGEMKKLKKALENLNENSLNSDFHSTRIKIKSLRYALEYFASSFDKKSLNLLLKTIKEKQEIFGNLQDIDTWQNFIQIYKNSMQEQNQISTFLCSFERLILGNSLEIKKEILENKARFIKILNKNIKALKIYKEI